MSKNIHRRVGLVFTQILANKIILQFKKKNHLPWLDLGVLVVVLVLVGGLVVVDGVVVVVRLTARPI